MGVNMKKNISIKEIAELSGVSIATVSRVINNNGRFSEETKKKVLKVIDETGYQLDYSAKTFRMKKSFSIGILVPDITNFFFSNLVEKIEEILFNQGYTTIICNTARDIDKERTYLNILEGKMIDGLIIISGADQFSYKSLNPNKHIPYVCIDREPKDNNNIFISSDHYQGAYEATKKLVSNGSLKPAIVMHKNYSSSAKERLRGFIKALEDSQLKYLENESILHLPSHKVKAENFIVNHLRQSTIDSLFVINDNLALDIISYLKSTEISIPNDIQIIGFDDIPACKYVTPQLTTVRQDTDTIANTAVNSLLDLVNGTSNFNNKKRLVPVKLILRDSTLQ